MALSTDFLDRLRGRVSTGARAPIDILSSYASALSSINRSSVSMAVGSRYSNMGAADYEGILARASAGIRSGSTLGLSVATKVASDVFTYATLPSLRVAGQAAGRYGNVISDYLSTKERFKQEFKMQGMQLGAMLGIQAGQWVSKYLGNGLIQSGVRTLAVAGMEALTGVGLIAVIPTLIAAAAQIGAGLLAKFVVGTAITAASTYVGSKVGEKFGEAYGDKYSKINLGENMFTMTRDVLFTYQESLPFLISRGGSLAYDDVLDIAEKLDRGAGMDLDSFGLDTLARLKYATEFSSNYSGSDLTGVAGLSMMLDNISGSDMKSAVQSYAASNPKAEAETLTKAVELYLGAAVGKGKVTKAGFEAAKGLMLYATQYSRSSLGRQDRVDKTFTGLYSFMEQANEGAFNNNIERVGTLTGAFDTLFEHIRDGDRIGIKFGQIYNISFKDTVGGFGSHPELINNLLKDISTHHDLSGVGVDKAGKITMKDASTMQNVQNMMMFFTQGRGGYNLSNEQTQEIVRAIGIQQTYGNVNFDSKGKAAIGKAALDDAKKTYTFEEAFVLARKAGDTTNKLLKISTKFISQMQSFSETVRQFYMTQGDLMAEVMIKEMNRLLNIEYTPGGNSGSPVYGTQGVTNFDAFPVIGPQGRKEIDVNTKGWKDFIVANYGPVRAVSIKNKLEEVAARLGIDPNELAAMYAVESSWNTRADNGSYFGMNQMGVAELRLIGLTPEAYKSMTPEQQIETTYTYLKKLNLLGKVKTAGDIYAVTIAQSYFYLKAKYGEDYVVYESNSKAFEKNAPAWDSDVKTDGGITIREIGLALYNHSKTKQFTSFVGTASLPPAKPGYTPPGVPPSVPGGSSRGDNIARVALSLYNAGNLVNPNTGTNYWKGWCAAFVNQVLKRTGDVNLFGGSAWSVRAAYLAKGLLQTKEQAGGYQVGDILFWNQDAANGGHVAIYIGNGQVVQAGNTSTQITVLSVAQAFGRSEDVMIYRAGGGSSMANPVVTNLGGTPSASKKDYLMAMAKAALGNLNSSKFLISVKETPAGYKFVVKYNTGNGYKIVSDQKILRTVENNIERELTGSGISVKEDKGSYYFLVEGSNVDVNKLAGALSKL